MEWEGLDELIQRLELAEKNAPKVIEKLEEDIAKVVLDDVVENTPASQRKPSKDAPIHSGNLKEAWKLRRTDGIEIYNDAKAKEEYYAWDVEYGHRTRAGMNLSVSSRRRKRRYNKKGKITFVPGVFMLKGAMKLGDKEMEEKGKKALEEILGG